MFAAIIVLLVLILVAILKPKLGGILAILALLLLGIFTLYVGMQASDSYQAAQRDSAFAAGYEAKKPYQTVQTNSAFEHCPDRMPHGERIRCVEQHGQPTHPDAPNWIENKPPARWPSFTKIPGKPRPVVKPGKALEMVAHVEQRWRDFKAGHAKEHPTIRETGAAMDALLTIDPSSPSFAAAWAAFVRLSKIDAEIGVYRRG